MFTASIKRPVVVTGAILASLATALFLSISYAHATANTPSANSTTAEMPAMSAPFSPVVSDPRIVTSFDLAGGETPEAIALTRDGSADVSLAKASTAVNVTRSGRVTPLGEVPRSGDCPTLGIPFGAGIARAPDGTVYLVDCTGNADTGVWRLHGRDPATQIARLPEDSVPHGMALDRGTGNLYVADSSLGDVWRIRAAGGQATLWASGPALQKISLFGANGIAVHQHAVWVSNTDQGTILEIPIRRDGTAGPIRTVASGFAGDIGSFTVVGRHDTIIAALTRSNEVVLIRAGEQPRVLLTALNGLSNPTSVALRDHILYVCNGAYFTGVDPNLLVARWER
jgi:DNA-binding beta-propeller fold protein YncE